MLIENCAEVRIKYIHYFSTTKKRYLKYFEIGLPCGELKGKVIDAIVVTVHIFKNNTHLTISQRNTQHLFAKEIKSEGSNDRIKY